MDQHEAEERVRVLVRRVVPTATVYFPRKRSYPLGHSWNGRHLRPTGETLESQLHEIAHLLIAPPERRHLPEFGLGPDPYKRNQVARVCSREEADREEVAACTLQLVLAHLLGLDHAAVRIEFQTAPLTRAALGDLRARYPDALPSGLWESALAIVHTMDGLSTA